MGPALAFALVLMLAGVFLVLGIVALAIALVAWLKGSDDQETKDS